MARSGELVGLDPAAMETEPGVRMQVQPADQRAANLGYLLTNDMLALATSTRATLIPVPP
jgi:hypothetical protein